MDFYNLDTKFTFGKFKEKTIKEIAEIQLSYLDWCAINVKKFYLTEEVVLELKNLNVFYKFTEHALKTLAKKHEKYLSDQENSASWEMNNYECYSYRNDQWLEDAAGSSDPEIMEVAYWNMD